MFIDEITIQNFGLFRGIQKLNFTPHTPDQPVILIGGLNGSGKTTLLNAIQLALYGKRARLSNRGNLSYQEYLCRSMHNETGMEETSITLQFRRWIDGAEQVFCVRRAWKANEQSVKESIVVMRNGVSDKYLTDTWAEFVEEIIPVEIAQLFFFDGEMIEGFADPENSKQLLSKAVNTLLGLDIITRLQADLQTLERRKITTLKSESEIQKIAEIDKAIKNLEEKIRFLNVDKRPPQHNNWERRKKDFEEAQENYNKSGGVLFDQRKEFESEYNSLETALQQNEAELREVAEGPAPLLLVGDLLNGIKTQHSKEEEAIKSTLVNQTLEQRDLKLLQLIQTLRVSGSTTDKIRQFLAEDRVRRAESEKTEIYLNLSPEGFQDLRDLQIAILPQIKDNIQELLNHSEDLQTRLVDVERKLGSIPEEDSIKELTKKREAAREALTQAETDLAETDAEIRRLEEEKKILQDKLSSLLEINVDKRFKMEDAERIIEHSRMARETMAKFRQTVTARHTGRIAGLVLDSFRRLLRKKSLVSRLTINEKNFDIEIQDEMGRTLSPDRLSAGERQLLAVSLLWGLARASGYPLPVAIDTPLGRLDAVHRDRLVENYFPQASHQVILLSTNKEIDAELFYKLKPFISHTFRLEYDDQIKATEIKSGYFEDLWQSELSNFRSRKKTTSLS